MEFWSLEVGKNQVNLIFLYQIKLYNGKYCFGEWHSKITWTWKVNQTKCSFINIYIYWDGYP